MIDINTLRQSLGAIQPEEVSELLDRLEAAEPEALEEARLNGMGSEREAVLMANLEAAEKARDFAKEEAERLLALAHDQNNELIRLREEGRTLRAKVAEMEKQSPICRIKDIRRAHYMTKVVGLDPEAWLYALPGAHPAPSVPKDELPDRDPDLPAEQQGLFRKFVVHRTDGSSTPGGKHYGCRYFVLDVDHDKHAVAALTAYAADCEKTHPELSKDLREKWGAQPAPSVPDGVAEALQRLIENGAVLGPASSEDALLVARYRQRLLACAPSVPDGWKLVPIEPTPMMKTAGIGVEVYQDSPPSSDCLTWEEAGAIYSAMLAAAPEAKP